MKKVRNKSQAGKYAKRKGSSSERAVAKLFEKWWDVPGTSFARTPGSGSFHTKSNSKNFNAAGDIVCSDPSFPFCIENKCQEAWDLAQLLTTDKGPINQFWAQTVTQCPQNKVPILVIGKNRKERLVVVRSRDYDQLILSNNPMVSKDLIALQTFRDTGIFRHNITYPVENIWYDEDICIISLKLFFRTNPVFLREHVAFEGALKAGVSNG